MIFFFDSGKIECDNNSSAFAELDSRSDLAAYARRFLADEPGEAPNQKFWERRRVIKKDRHHGHGRGDPF